MPTFYDSTGKSHVLTHEIGRGGEGAVYFCKGNPKFVAKIYHQPITEEKAEKLRWMAENNHEILQKVAAWVVETLHEKPDGKIVGFLMPNINAKEIHELYSLKSRRVHFPDANWYFLIHTATNVARAFYSLQKYDHVMGDVNHGNCVVLADGTAKLIDCDSYAIKADEKRYTCEVGVATHLAPELQKASLSEIERLPKHDNFGLAVIIFQLLFLGRHPFSGNYLGEKDKTLEDCIREYRFAFGKNSGIKMVQQPPGTLSLREVSPRVAVLFERAFEEKTTRPTPTEWIEALVDLSENLEQCIFHPGHHFYNSLPSCPWCKLESKTGLILFPFTIKGENGDGEKPFNIYTVENLLANIGTSKKNLPTTLPQPVYAQSLDPTPAIANKALKERNIQILIGSFYVVSIIISAFIFEFVVVCIFNFLLLSFCIYLVKLTGKPIRDELDRSLAKLQNELEMLQNKWAKFVLFDDSDKEVNEIRKKVENYKKLQQKSVKDLKRLHTDIRSRQFNEHLRSSKLQGADILGMTDEKLEFLNKKGIKTAAEVTEKRLLYYYNIDNETTEKLLEWQREIEGKFKYNSKPEIIHVEKEKIKQRTSEERNKIEEDINELLKFTGSGSTQLKEKQEELTTQSKQYREAISQVETNKETLGDPTKTITALVYISVIITFVFPFLGVVFSEGYFFTANDPQYIVKKVSDNYDPPILSDDTLTEIPDERITNQEIAEMPVSERNRIITALISRSLSRFGNYAAEKDLNFALRFDKKNIQVLGELGSVLYKEKEYSESLSILQYAVNLGDESDVTKKYIGMNYLQLKRYEDAYYIFLEMTEGTKGSYEAYFNLGLAYKGLDDYKSAKMAFQMALFHDGENAEAHYELGFVFYKLNEKEEFNKQYKKLLDIDKGKAEYLMASVNKSPPPDQLLIK